MLVETATFQVTESGLRRRGGEISLEVCQASYASFDGDAASMISIYIENPVKDLGTVLGSSLLMKPTDRRQHTKHG